MRNPDRLLPTAPEDLYRTIESGDENAYAAWQILSNLANGGNEAVRNLVNQLEKAFASGEIKMPVQLEKKRKKLGMFRTKEGLLPPDNY
ncbi:MAG: hypothetical protein ABII10_03205 [Candidatus Paceibacterota bacterium]